MSKVSIYASGLVHCSVCADKDMPVADIENAVNGNSPTGISSQWKKSDAKFADGSDNPHVCEQDQQRMHYLMVC